MRTPLSPLTCNNETRRNMLDGGRLPHNPEVAGSNPAPATRSCRSEALSGPPGRAFSRLLPAAARGLAAVGHLLADRLGERPAGEEGECLRGGSLRCRAVDVDALALVPGEFEGLEVEGEVTDERVVEALDAAAVVPHVVGSPSLPEALAAGGEFSDEVLEVLVVRVPSGFGAKEGDGVVLDLVEVEKELGGGGVEEGEAGGVGGVRFLVRGL